jgi:hypothetical protein
MRCVLRVRANALVGDGGVVGASSLDGGGLVAREGGGF